MNTKTLIKTFLILSLLFVASYALADGNGSIGYPSNGLSLSSNDQSRYYLGMIFGSVGNVLNGTGSQILGVMFGEFNRAVLILGTIVFTYVYGKGVLDTAAHGEFLGKQANSLWVPLRSIGGLALMIPKASSGYCVIQVFLMWVVLQGVGAADMLWSTLAGQLQNSSSGSEANATAVVSGAIATQLTSQVQNVFSGLVCGYSLQKSQNSGSVVLDYSANGNNRSYDIAYSPAPGEKAVSCSTIQWKNACQAGDTACQKLASDQKSAIENMVNNLKPIASFYVNDSYRYCESRDAQGNCITPAFPQSLNDAGSSQTVAEHVYNLAGKINFPQNQSINYVSSLAGEKASSRNNNPAQRTGNDMVDDGWIFAGSYIYDLAKSVNKAGTVPNFSASVANMGDISGYFPKNYPDPIKMSEAYAQNLPSDQASAGNRDTGANDTQKKLIATFAVMTTVSSVGLVAAGGMALGAGIPALSVMTGALIGIICSFDAIINLIIHGNGGPLGAILYLQTFGYIVLAIVGITFGLMLVAIFTQALGENVMNCMQPVGFAAAETFSYVSYLVMATFGALLTIGIFLAVYLPLLPFIYFTFGVLSWLVAVFETMIAAPIVALGIIHPEGHDFWGKAEPAVMLTVNVFLRPSLMLFGLMAAVLLGYVFVDIITVGFGQAVFNMQDKGGAMANPIEAICMMGLYTFLVVVGYSQCFKLITETGNRVLSWLGFQGQLGMQTDDAVGQMKQNSSAIGGAMSSGFKDTESKLRDKAGNQRKKEEGGSNTGMSSDNNKTHSAPNSQRTRTNDPATLGKSGGGNA